jgi:ribosomal protein S18 acetylase RimI-like enzyme
MASIQIRPLTPEDKSWAVDVLTRSWGSTRVVSCGKLHDAASLPGLIAMDGEQRVGLATYRIEDQASELLTLNALQPGLGVGTQLVEAVAAEAVRAGCVRLWLVTTNDNIEALRFYQTRGFQLVELRCDAMDQYRELKPEIPLIGENGIPIRDEWVLERLLENNDS